MDWLFLLKWLAAFSPIGVVLILMIVFNWGGGRAGAAGWFTAVFASVVFFGATPKLLALAQMKGVLLALNVLYIIWMALFHYNAVNETGAIKAIGVGIQKFSSDKAIQIIIVGWVFGSFLQGVAGYGVPIAVIAPLLAGLGFNPVVAVAVPTIAHSWAVTFGSMGASFQTMMAVTGLSAGFLAPWAAVLLGLACFLCAIGAVHIAGGGRMLAHSSLALLLIGSVMVLVQYGLAVSGMWTVGAFGAGLAGIAASLVVARIPMYRGTEKVEVETEMPFGWALVGYVVLIAVVAVGVSSPAVKQLLASVKLSLHFPEIKTTQGWVVPAGLGKSIKIFGHGGALLFYASVLSFIIYRMKGYYTPEGVRNIWKKTVKSGVATSLGIVSMVSFAVVMDQSGMIYLLAKGISRVFGAVYPFISPWIGLLGAFMTGSNTNSNVVFGVLQQQTAHLAGISTAIILAAQTTGGALGSMIAPAKILVGCSTIGLAGKEGPVLRAVLIYGLIFTAVIGLATWAAIALGL